jgi:hypothetical protein
VSGVPISSGDERIVQGSPFASFGSQVLEFAIPLAAVYLWTNELGVWLAGRIHDWILPIIFHGDLPSRFQFLFSHLFVFAFMPALVSGFLCGHRRTPPAFFVWIIPTIVLGYKFVSFPAGVFENHFQVAAHYYFGGDFLVGEFRNFSELFQMAGPDMMRGMEQLRITGPFYAGLGYSLGALLALRVQIPIIGKMIQGEKHNANYLSDTASSS